MPIQRSNEPEAFTAFERKGWGASIGGYERHFGRVTSQTVEATLAAARVTRGCRVLAVGRSARRLPLARTLGEVRPAAADRVAKIANAFC